MSHMLREVFASANAAVTGSNAYYTTAQYHPRSAGVGYHIKNGAAATGVWTAWVSNVPRPVMTTDADWVDITDRLDPAPEAVTSGSPAADFIGLGGIEAAWSRLKWANNATTSVPSVYVNVKEST